jgi:hypothetical protein
MLGMKLEEAGDTLSCGEQDNSCPHDHTCGRIGGEDGTGMGEKWMMPQSMILIDGVSNKWPRIYPSFSTCI